MKYILCVTSMFVLLAMATTSTGQEKLNVLSSVGESCVWEGYRKSNARAFAELNERLASQARATFAVKPVQAAKCSARIAISSRNEGKSGISIVNADGTGQQRLTKTGSDFLPRWSPDGKQIAFLSLREQDHELAAEHDLAFHWFLYVMDADGQNQRRVTTTPIGMIFQWSPDGSQILFQSSCEDANNKGKDGTVSSAIYVMKTDGTQQKRLTAIDKIDNFPTWSPDGKRIAFCSNRGGNMDIFVMNADGSGVLRLTDNKANDINPIWSPNGSQIAFTSFRVQDGGSVFLVRIDGSDEQLICDEGMPVAWSPDSRRILITKDGRLATVDTDGQQETSLTEPGRRALDAAFTLNGSTILYRTRASDGWEIWSVDVNGTEPKRITGDVGNITGFSIGTQR